MKNERKRTWAEIHLDRLERNVRNIRSITGGKCEIMAVVKADAYGHGDIKICEKLIDLGITNFAVSNIDEAESVRSADKNSEILILGYTCPEYAEELIDRNITQGIVSKENAMEFSKAAQKCGKTLKCHIKLDTGMGRIGLKYPTPDQCAEEIVNICNMPNLNVSGIYTHFSCADSNSKEDIEYTNNQRMFIEKTYDKANEMLAEKSIKHMHYLNSAGLIYYGCQRSTLAREGIILYGLMPNAALPVPIELEPVMELKTVVAHIKYVNKGDCIGYGRTFTAPEKMKIATLPIGYADGYPRALSSKGQVLINGVRCNIVGRICMDQLMCDVSEIKDVKTGDTATLFGKDKNEFISADELASIYGSIGYELVCGISKRVPRIYTE